jgi:glycosyltransferase involved in cell wall biosynthesis
MRVASFFPIHFSNSGIGYCALSLIEAMESDDMHGSIMATTSDKDFSNPFYQDAIPSFLNPIIYKLFTVGFLNKIAEWRFLQLLDTHEFVYFWSSDVPLSLYEKVHARGHRIIMEAVNTSQVYRRTILDAEYLRLGLPATHGATADSIATENAKFALASFVYSCSPEVEKSLAAAGVPDEKLLHTSYGLRQSDILSPSDIQNRKQHTTFTAIFVGSIGVRKGVHLLVDYWSRSEVKGKLKLVGHIDEEIKPILAPYLERDDIEHVPFVNDLRDIYKEADVFMLPTLEEGSPLVTYLALGAGLPSIVSPMGSGGLIEDGEEGLVLDPHDEAGWIKALQQMAEDSQLRENFANNAYQKAPDYLWSEVGRKRAEALSSKA